MRLDRLQPFSFLRRGSHDQLAAMTMRNALVAAIPIERLSAADAHPRHQAARSIIDAGMDHLAVARGGDGANSLGRFQDDDLAAALCQPPGDGKTDDSRTDDDTLDLVHSKILIRIPLCDSALKAGVVGRIYQRCPPAPA